MKTIIKSKRGLISIQALWIMAIISFMVTGLAMRTLLNIRMTRRSIDKAQTNLLTHSVIEAVKYSIGTMDSITCNYEGRCLQPQELDIIIMQDTFRIQINQDSRLYNSSENYSVDEQSKINLNTAPRFLLENLFNNPILVDEIVYFRRLQSKFYKNSDFIGRSIQGDSTITGAFHLVDDLLYLDNFTIDDLRKYSKFLTTFGNGRININTVSDEVLSFTGCPPSLIAKLNMVKQLKTSNPGSPPNHIFSSIETLAADLIRRNMTVTTEEINYLKNMQNYRLLDTKSEYLSYSVSCKKLNGSRDFNITEIIHKPVGQAATCCQRLTW
ncbi:MAG: hypothetical protein SVO01_11080 [Thermotogota bacterium]|nr:hypothetical protein [Thermotogota bacterium]